MDTRLMLKTLLIFSLVGASSYSMASSNATEDIKDDAECATKHQAQAVVPEDNMVLAIENDLDPHAAVYGMYQDRNQVLLDSMVPDNADALLVSSKIELTRALSLSSEQEQKINDLSESLRSHNWNEIGKIISSAEKLRNLYAEPKPNAEAIGESFKQIFDIKREMIVTLIDTENKAYDVLTEDQRQMLLGNNAQMQAMH